MTDQVVSTRRIVAAIKKRHDPNRPRMNPIRLPALLAVLGLDRDQGPALSRQLQEIQRQFRRYRIRHGYYPTGWIYDPVEIEQQPIKKPRWT